MITIAGWALYQRYPRFAPAMMNANVATNSWPWINAIIPYATNAMRVVPPARPSSPSVIATPVVVNAAGPWSAPLAALAGVEIPVTPIRRQWLTTTPLPEVPAHFPFIIDFARSLYFHREGEGLLTGMSNPSEAPGFDQRVDPEWELTHLDAAVARLPLLEHAGIASRWAGLYEVTPDAHPIMGASPVEGFYLVTGFSGHGFMHGPICGQLMAEVITDGQAATLDIRSLALTRFAEGKAIGDEDVEYNVV